MSSRPARPKEGRRWDLTSAWLMMRSGHALWAHALLRSRLRPAVIHSHRRVPHPPASACAFGMTIIRMEIGGFAQRADESVDTSRNSDHATLDCWIRSAQSLLTPRIFESFSRRMAFITEPYRSKYTRLQLYFAVNPPNVCDCAGGLASRYGW